MKLFKAIVTLSGLIHLRTNSFKKGNYSNFLPHSRGSFYSSGASSLYHSLNLLGVSSIFWAKLVNSESLINPWIESHAVYGSQSKGFSVPGIDLPWTKKSI